MGDLNDAQRAWLKAVGADIDIIERPSTGEQPTLRGATMSAAPIQSEGAGGNAGAGGGGGDGGSGSDVISKTPPPNPHPVADARQALDEAKEVAKDLVEELNGQRPSGKPGPFTKQKRDTRRLKARLREIANRSPATANDPAATKAAELLAEIENRENELRVRQIERERTAGAAKRAERDKKAAGKADKSQSAKDEATGGGKSKGGATHDGGSGAPHTDGGGGGAKVASKVDTSKAEAFARQVDELLKQSKAPKFDAEKVEKQSLKLENEGEVLARELQASPELKAFSGSKAKEFFAGVHAKYGSVRASAAGIIVLALNVSDAYALLKEVRSILDSKTLREGLERTFALGKNVVKGQIEFGVLRFVFRSTPVAIGIQVFLGDMDMNLGLGPNGKFDQEIAALVNKVRPGSVDPAAHHDNVTNFKDGDAKKLFMEARAQAIAGLRQEIGEGLEKFGYDDGLVGAKPKTKFEVSKLESEVLKIDEQWFAKQYGQGLTRGGADMTKTLGRVVQEGQKDGKEGKAFRFEALLQWPEITAALKGGSAFEAYKDAYDAAYREARGGFDTRTVTKFKLSAGGGEAHAEKYGRLMLYADLEYSNGTKDVISQEVQWSVDQPTIADVAYDKGSKITRAHLIGSGKVKITGKLVSGDKTFEDSMTVSVSPPKIRIVPALSGNYAVGLELQLTARTETWPVIADSDIVWSTSPPGIVKIDEKGNALMLKPGQVEISVTEKTKGKPARASVKIKVVAAK